MKTNELKNLVPLRKPRDYDNILALDIETSSEGDLLDIGMATKESYLLRQDWNDCLSTLMKLTGNWRICAHNGFGFDYIGLVQFLISNFKKFGLKENDITFLSSEYLLIAIIIRTEHSTLTFIDTMRFFPGMSLEKIGQSMFGEGKHTVPNKFKGRMEEFKRLYPTKYYAYLKQDCQLLYKVYTVFRDKVNNFQNIGELGLSSGSSALKSFRRYLHNYDSEMMIYSAPREYMGAAEEALRGGLTLYIGDGKEDKKHHYENVNSYDVISMYPSIQRHVPVPTSPLVSSTKIEIDSNDRVVPGYYLCNFTQSRGRIPILFEMDRKTPHPVWSGDGLLSHFEIEFLRRFGKINKVYDGAIFQDYAYPFTDFMNDGLQIRLSAKAEKNDALALALKILLNSLYGKFAQSPTIEQVAMSANVDWYDSIIEAQIHSHGESQVVEYHYSDDCVLFGIPSESTSFSNRFIGGMITSLARLKLGLIYNTIRPIYCDTDSIYTQDEISSVFIGHNAGDFEIKDMDKPMICLGKKSYAYGKEIYWKGIPKASISQKELKSAASGKSIKVEYRSPTAMKSALKKKIQNPNKFESRHRTVKAGKSLKDVDLLRLDESFFKIKDVCDFLDSFEK